MKLGTQVEIIEYEGSTIDFEEMKKRKVASELSYYIVENFEKITEVDRRPDQYRGDVVRYIYETNIVTMEKHQKIMKLLQIMGSDAKYRQDWPTLDNINKVANLLND